MRPGPPQQCLPFNLKGNTPLFACPWPLSQVRPPKGLHPPPPSACSPAWFLSHCQSTMAVIINGLSQCDSCGPLKIGLNNKILAYGNFFSSPVPSFSLPHFGLVMHANALPSSSFPNTFLLGMAGMGWQGDRLRRVCLPVKDLWQRCPPHPPPRGPLVDLALGKVPDTCDLCHPPPEVPTPGFSSYLPCAPPRAPLRWPPLRSYPGPLQLPSLLPAPSSISPLPRLLTRPTPSYQLPPAPPLHSSPHSCLCPEPEAHSCPAPPHLEASVHPLCDASASFLAQNELLYQHPLWSVSPLLASFNSSSIRQSMSLLKDKSLSVTLPFSKVFTGSLLIW